MIIRETERVVSDQHVSASTPGDFKSVRIEFGLRLLHFLCDPEVIGFERLVQAATRRSPEVLRRFYAAGPGRSREALTRLIASGHAQDLICADDPTAAAGDLAGLWQGFLRAEFAFGQLPQPTDAELRHRATHGVNQFLRLYAPTERDS